MCEATESNSECTVFIHRQHQANPSFEETTPFTVDTASALQPALRSCDLCGPPCERGTLGGESLHRTHRARVTKGMEWIRERAKESGGAGGSIVQDDVNLKGGENGRIVSFRADVSGKVACKWVALKLLEARGLTLTTYLVLCDPIYDQSRAFRSKSH